MTRTLNCWEVKNCGRLPGGRRADEFGVCPAATDSLLDGVNGGVNAGRACWAIAGTLCGGEVQGSSAMKLGLCMRCDFYKLVVREQSHAIAPAATIQSLLRAP